VDNLVHAIFLSLIAKGVDGEAFLICDRERVTWADLYHPVAEALGYDFPQIPEGAPPETAADWRNRLERVRCSKPVQTFLSIFPQKLRYAAYAAFASFWESPRVPSPWVSPAKPVPAASLEMALLYRCQYQLPWAKAEKMLGYQPIISFAEACRRTVAWLAFAGYPVKDSNLRIMEKNWQESWMKRTTETKQHS
jgi:nucleoside-diphosphate-sugar epimerase